MFIIWWIIVGLIAGWITGKIMKGSGYGALMDIVVGIVGAIIGGVLMRMLGFVGEGGMIYTIIVAVILTLIIRLLKRPDRISTIASKHRISGAFLSKHGLKLG